ncbi:MAG: SDR family oxidoreductase [Candidatus Freyarchaeota archaeon]|nr:SDR family oxidoreductase [Candidatus Jordarchaeia archaeon]
MRLDGKVALVVGAGSIGSGVGNGRAISILFAREGARVVCADINFQSAEETVKMIREEGGEAAAVQGDATKSGDAKRLVDFTVELYGKLNILVNVVGIASGLGVLETSEDEWDRVLTTNLKSIFLMSKHAVPAMIKSGGGAIINISSAAAFVAHPCLSYGTTKAAIINMTRCMAVDLAKYNIRVNCIAPGFLDTPMVAPIMDDTRRAFLRQVIPLGKIGTAWDTAYAALYLASDEASYVTGTTLIVDGGLLAAGGRRRGEEKLV